jgi:hypothetical protein
MTQEFKNAKSDWELYLKATDRCMKYATAVGIAIGHLKVLKACSEAHYQEKIDKAIAEVEKICEEIYAD